jgi:hypothetical protein
MVGLDRLLGSPHLRGMADIDTREATICAFLFILVSAPSRPNVATLAKRTMATKML